MDVKEYLLSLLAILTGLAIGDMVVSLHGLLRRFRQVHWDWLPVTAAAFVFVVIVSSWWTSWNSLWEGIRHFDFIVVLCQLIALFLAAKAVLPDDKDEDRLDLLDYYVRVSRYVWLAMAAIPVLMMAPSIYKGNAFREPADFFTWSWPLLTYLAVTLTLALVKRIAVHRLLVPIALIFHLVQFGAVSLRTPI